MKENIPTNIGDRFGKLILIEKIVGRIPYFICKCDCGNEKKIRRDHLKSGGTTSCGCVRNEKTSKRAHKLHKANTTHGMSGTKIHNTWFGIKQRCYNPNNRFFSYYGGRGIKVCDRWLESFENFLADMGVPNPTDTIERINTNGGYEPTNCKWATRKEQMTNTRRNHWVTFNNETLMVTQWAKRYNLPSGTLSNRIYAGWPIEEALTTPILRQKSWRHKAEFRS